MNRALKTWLPCSFVVVLLALPLVACGGDTFSVDPSAKAAVLDAATKTASVKGARVSLTGTFEKAGQTFQISGEGVQDLAGSKGRMTMRTSGAGQEIEMEALFDEFVIYMRSDLFEGELPGGAKWMKLDLRKAAETLGADFSEVNSGDATQGLEQLKASGEVETVGTEEIRGVETTHYRATVDPAKLPEMGKIGEVGKPEYGPLDTWIDAAGYVRRMTISYSYSMPGQDRVKTSQTTDLYDFGIPVDVQAPTADVFDGTNIAIDEINQAG